MQLTGVRVSDPNMQSIKTVKALLGHLCIPPKPKKLAQVLAKDGRLSGLANVKLYDRRVTSVDKEREVGRWKVIERELKARDLPIFNSDA